MNELGLNILMLKSLEKRSESVAALSYITTAELDSARNRNAQQLSGSGWGGTPRICDTAISTVSKTVQYHTEQTTSLLIHPF